MVLGNYHDKQHHQVTYLSPWLPYSMPPLPWKLPQKLLLLEPLPPFWKLLLLFLFIWNCFELISWWFSLNCLTISTMLVSNNSSPVIFLSLTVFWRTLALCLSMRSLINQSLINKSLADQRVLPTVQWCSFYFLHCLVFKSIICLKNYSADIYAHWC